MDLAVSHVDRMALVFRDQLRANPVVSGWAGNIERIEFPLARSAASNWIDVSAAEMGIVKSDGTRCMELRVVLSVGINHKQFDVDLPDEDGSFATLVEAIMSTARLGQALQVGSDILSKGVEQIEQVFFGPVEGNDRVTMYRVLEIEHRVDVDPQTWLPRASS